MRAHVTLVSAALGAASADIGVPRGSYPTKARALRNIRIQGESSPQPSGCHENSTERNTRSGCGMRMVKRPSGVVSAVMPWGEPLGLYGYTSLTLPRLST